MVKRIGITTSSVDNPTPESTAMEDVALAAASCQMRLQRNNRGAFKNDYGGYTNFGLGNEGTKESKEMLSSDYVGGTRVTITPDMVGKTVFIYTAIEVKPAGWRMREFKPGTREHGQQKYLEWVVRMGGFAGFATCANDLKIIYNHFMTWLKSK